MHHLWYSFFVEKHIYDEIIFLWLIANYEAILTKDNLFKIRKWQDPPLPPYLLLLWTKWNNYLSLVFWMCCCSSGFTTTEKYFWNKYFHQGFNKTVCDNKIKQWKSWSFPTMVHITISAVKKFSPTVWTIRWWKYFYSIHLCRSLYGSSAGTIIGWL